MGQPWPWLLLWASLVAALTGSPSQAQPATSPPSLLVPGGVLDSLRLVRVADAGGALELTASTAGDCVSVRRL